MPKISTSAAALAASAAALAAILLASSAAHAAPLTLRTDLSGDQEVPTVETPANGTALLRVDRLLRDIRFDVRVRGAVGVTQAHIHCGPAGVNGPVVAFLFGPADPPVDVTGRLAVGTITNDDIMPTEGEPCGMVVNNIASLYSAMLSGNAYVNVHTVDNPGGEVRGQIFP